MQNNQANPEYVLIDGSRLITEACVRAGAEVFIGYPITPANLLYLYGARRYPTMLPAPDEITTLQWMSGFSAAGKIPVTATSFPGYALMVESINMAFMMELPMVIILVQRLGPSTGTATAGAQGDVNVIHGTLSGGFSLPTLCISNLVDCWDLSARAVELAVKLRSPVVLLTSKEMVMTLSSFDLSRLEDIQRAARDDYEGQAPYCPYLADENLVRPFLPVTQSRHQVRLTASTHNTRGILQNVVPEALANTRRLEEKAIHHLPEYTYYELDEQDGADILLVSYGITAQASRQAIASLREAGQLVSLLIARTLFPIPSLYGEIASRYKRVVVAEENLVGQYRRLIFGRVHSPDIRGVQGIGKMILPEEIIREIKRDE
jgi:2-oxoglutarate/2-oxoacid ferredoxin oxidoreductase subunit alpha